jgi:predicted nucleotidyltransferase
MNIFIKKLLREGLMIDASLNEVTNELDFSSFKIKDTLNPEVWQNENQIKSNLKELLIKIANDYYKTLKLNIPISDITLTGSLANYNWSKYSDFDIHILIDLDEAKEKKELYEELFRLKKTIFNAAHDIRIKGFETELFVQDLNEENNIQGIYSLVDDKWIKVPKKEEFKIDEKKLKGKVEQWVDIIDGVLENAKDEDLEDAVRLVKKYRDKLRKYRTCGLEKEGEFSYENLVFKYLRRNGYIAKLENFKNKIVDKKLSLEQQNIE